MSRASEIIAVTHAVRHCTEYGCETCIARACAVYSARHCNEFGCEKCRARAQWFRRRAWRSRKSPNRRNRARKG